MSVVMFFDNLVVEVVGIFRCGEERLGVRLGDRQSAGGVLCSIIRERLGMADVVSTAAISN